MPARAVDALQKTRGVLAITPDQPVEAFGRHRPQNQLLPTGVDRIDADRSTLAAIHHDGGAVDADVAVLDTGIATHPELNIVGGTACVGKNGYTDGDGHGTHVAGTIGARTITPAWWAWRPASGCGRSRSSTIRGAGHGRR